MNKDVYKSLPSYHIRSSQKINELRN